MKDYLYDGTFEGFLTCVYFHYYEDKASGIFVSDHYQPNMLHSFQEVTTDLSFAMRVYDSIEKKISKYDLQRIYRVYLSNVSDKEMLLLNYIRFGFKSGGQTSLYHGNPFVSPVEKAEKKVTVEIHRILGLLRFSVLEGEILYAVLEPEHDILELLADHFTDRYKNDPFIIHDTKRGKAMIAHKGSWYITNFSEEQLPAVSKDEKLYQQLWREYFQTIAIKERINPRCQKNFMPVRYWKNLTEFKA